MKQTSSFYLTIIEAYLELYQTYIGKLKEGDQVNLEVVNATMKEIQQLINKIRHDEGELC